MSPVRSKNLKNYTDLQKANRTSNGMRFKQGQQGFSAFESILAVLVLTVIGFAGYMVYSRQQSQSDDSSTYQSKQANEQSPTANDVSSAPEIKDASDLDEAIKVLDQNDPSVSNNDAKLLDNEASNF